MIRGDPFDQVRMGFRYRQADLTETDEPFKVAMRQIAGVFAQLEKARLVGKLKAARDRKPSKGSKVEGRKNYREIDARDHDGRMIILAKKLRRKSPKGGVGHDEQ